MIRIVRKASLARAECAASAEGWHLVVSHSRRRLTLQVQIDRNQCDRRGERSPKVELEPTRLDA